MSSKTYTKTELEALLETHDVFFSHSKHIGQGWRAGHIGVPPTGRAKLLCLEWYDGSNIPFNVSTTHGELWLEPNLNRREVSPEGKFDFIVTVKKKKAG